MNSNKVLSTILAGQVLLLLAVLSRGNPDAVMAQVPDGGAQRERQLDELRRMSDRLDRIADLLQSGKLEVRTRSADEK